MMNNITITDSEKFEEVINSLLDSYNKLKEIKDSEIRNKEKINRTDTWTSNAQKSMSNKFEELIESYAQIDLNIEKQVGIFEDIGDSLKVWASHKDEVITLPDDFEILASSSKCAIEAMKHKDKDIYGIQFHPEVQHTPRGGEIFENFYKLCKN